MKIRLRMLAVLLVGALILTGCRRTDYAENQVYAIMLGMDITDNEEISLTICYPKLSGSSGGSGGSGDPAYDSKHAVGANFQQALNNLKYIAPRDINLSALTMVVVSENLVKAGKLDEALDGLTSNYRMYSAAYIAVCKGEAKGFVESQQPQVGSRLSEGLKALVENAEEIGYIPGSRLADVYYRIDSVYSDPMIMLCCQENNGEQQKSSSAEEESGKTENDNIYAGACIINNGNEIIELDAYQTMFANVITGDVKQFSYAADNVTAAISVDKSPSVKISAKDKLTIDIEFQLSGMKMSGNADIDQIAEALKADISGLINVCKAAGAEPFGFADKAAMKFSDIEKWENYGWAEKFRECEINIRLSLVELF